ncbi:class I SAM-dependent methyltransferase [Saccharothrix sp. Mg75]|uniref:class I SAM-dependent methyltransferase n=1 Tax=Saccharothrix sp. Mg75 TaxID=3445357 RepID=UPI003EEA867D
MGDEAAGTGGTAPRDFHDGVAERYHLLHADWDASVDRQGAALDGVLRRALGPAALGHRVVATDLSPVAAAREARARGLRLTAAAADVRSLPVRAGDFDAVVCADNSLPHLLTADDVRAALASMRRALAPGGLLVVTTRPYDDLLATRPTATPVRSSTGPAGRAMSSQLWHWDDDGEHYDLELFQLAPGAGRGPPTPGSPTPPGANRPTPVSSSRSSPRATPRRPGDGPTRRVAERATGCYSEVTSLSSWIFLFDKEILVVRVTRAATWRLG